MAENAGLISNPELLQLLHSKGADPANPDATAAALPSERKACGYLAQQGVTPRSRQQVEALVAALAEFDLMKAEVLQILNLRPSQVRWVGGWG